MKNKIFLLFFLSLFVFFMFLLIAHEQGYYKNRYQKVKELTDEQIIEFEKDIKSGKNIDVTRYVLYEEKDYTTNLSNDVYKISLKFEKLVDKTVKAFFNKAAKSIYS